MKWKIRPGFSLFAGVDQAVEHQLGNRMIRPRARGGDVVKLTAEELRILVQRGQLGMLAPADKEADEYFGNTVPIQSKSVTEPATLLAPVPEPA